MNFTSTISGREWKTTDKVGISATCTREGNTGTGMSTASPACFSPLTEGPTSYLVKMSEDDNILAKASDHGFLFCAYTPYDPDLQDLGRIPANVPSMINYGEDMSIIYVARANVTGVVAPVKLDFSSISCMLNLQIPEDIVAESATVLRKMVIKAAEGVELEDDIAYDATYNLLTGEIDKEEGSGSKEITVDFGQSGYRMSAGYTSMSLLMAPFKVPEQGFKVEFTDINGDVNTVPLLANAVGTEYPGGSVIDVTLSSSSDGVIPCSPPVEWPIGYRGGAGVFSNSTQPRWLTEHVWTSSQPQATMTYVISEDNPLGDKVKFETNNFPEYNYSAGCVKGSWTGDYFEFDVPVRNFKEGTEVTLTLPTYGRGAPLFWDVLYLDGEVWKCDRKEHTSPDGQFKENSTLMIEHGNRDGNFEGICYKVKMTFENAIKSGHLYIRLQVVSGQHITVNASEYAATCLELSEPSTAGKSLFAFVNKSGTYSAIKIEW